MIIAIIIILSLIGIDQLTKALVVSHIEYGIGEIVIIKDFFRLMYVKNNGAAFSWQIPLPILIVVTIICLLAFGYFIYKKCDFKNNKLFSISLCLLASGTIGNFIDRLFRDEHKVVDFLSFSPYYIWFKDGKLALMQFDFAVFNMADVFLTFGVILLFIYILFIEGKKHGKKNNN